MLHRIGALKIVICVILLGSTLPGYAEDAPQLHPGPWPIWHWQNHQPRQDQLDAMHKSNVTPEELREIDRLYMQLERFNPKILVHPHRARRPH